jgi:hypothetical protein
MARVGEAEPPCREAATRILRIVPAFIRRLRSPSWSLDGLVLGGVQAHGGPDEACEFACDGDGDLGSRLASFEHSVEAAVETMHRLVCDRDDAWGLPFASLSQAENAGPMAVVPGRLDE